MSIETKIVPNKDYKKYSYLSLLALLLTLKASTPAGSHSFRHEAVNFHSSELGCLIGRNNKGRCKCGQVDLAQELPCGDSHACACGFEHCACPKLCNQMNDPCTKAQECKADWPGNTEDQQRKNVPEGSESGSTKEYDL